MTLFLDTTDPVRGETLLTLLRAHWPLWATAALGLGGIYGLLPNARRSKPIWAGFGAAAAILLAGIWFVDQDGVWPEQVLFYAFALLAVVGGVLMLAQSNPVHAALSFALVVLSTCGLFLLLAAPFLMAATIIIYAGAIVVTFLFVITLAQQAGLANADARSREPFLASLAGFVLLGALWCVFDKSYDFRAGLRQLEQLAGVKSLEEAGQLLGEPAAEPGVRTLPAMARFKSVLPKELGDKVSNLEPAWAARDLDALRKTAARLHGEAVKLQPGTLKKPDWKPGWAPPPEPPVTAQNVAGLGRALFTRYLIPVELAGVLLLVATIGAIAIAGRRGEGLR